MTSFGKDRFEVSDELGTTRTFEDSQVKVEQIMDQKDLVDGRQQNIREIAEMMSRVNQISKEMNTLIHRQDEKLDSITRTQDRVQDNAHQALGDMVETDRITRKKLKKVAIWAAVVVLLGLCVVGLVYIIKGGKKSDGGSQASVAGLGQWSAAPGEKPGAGDTPPGQSPNWPWLKVGLEVRGAVRAVFI